MNDRTRRVPRAAVDRAGAGGAAAASARHHHVAIVGAGFSGIGLAIGLLRRRTRDFVVFERAGNVGGTWRDNAYPGSACDVPSHLYSYSFAPNPRWSRSFSPQQEIEAYLLECAERFGVLPHVRLSCEVVATAWDGAAQRWRIETTRGAHTADVLVSARGPLSEPRLPELPGLGSFQGVLFHSARWDREHDLTTARVAVIGTGASAIQFIPEIQPLVRSLHVFQRTPPWVLPRRDRRLSRVEQALYGSFPPARLVARAGIYWGRELYVAGFVGTPARRRSRARVARWAARGLLERQVHDPALRAKLEPAYEIGCKRVLLSNDYYRAVAQPNVEVVTEPIAAVRAEGIVTGDGKERAVDTIIFGTGFDVTGHAAAASTFGRSGLRLADAWAPRLAAYKGMTVSGFPNLFFMVGPNSGIGHSSIVFVIESQIAYILDALDVMRRRGVSSVEVTRSAEGAWTARVDRRSADTVWTGGTCRSYYLDEHGRNVALWPGTSWSYRRATRRFDPGAYTVQRATVPTAQGPHRSVGPPAPAPPAPGPPCAGPASTAVPAPRAGVGPVPGSGPGRGH